MGLRRWLSGKRIYLPMKETHEMWIRFMGWEDMLEKEMGTHFSILPWRISMDRGACLATDHVVAKSQTRPSD